MADTKTQELYVIPTSPSKNISLKPIGALPEPYVDGKVLASIRSAKVELERFKKNDARDAVGTRRLETDSALGSSHGSNNGSGYSGSSERSREIEKNRLEAAVRASQNEIRNLEQAATEATNKHKSATKLQRTKQTTINHLTHYNQLLEEQILSRRQILDRLESTELEHDESVELDTNNETVRHDRRRKDMEHRRILRRVERKHQVLNQSTLESQLNGQQKLPKRHEKQMDNEMRAEANVPMTARELRETLEEERRQRQNNRYAPPPIDKIEKDSFRDHNPSADPNAHPAHDENFSFFNQRVQEGYVKPKNDHSHRQTTCPPAAVIENDDSLYAVSEPSSIKISQPSAAAAPAAPAASSEQNKATAADTFEISPFLHRLHSNDENNNNNNNNKKFPSVFIEEPTMRPCQAPADALAYVIHGLEGELAISKEKLSELVKVYNDHNAALKKRLRKSLALRIENLLAETERKSDYLYSLHDVVVGGK